MVKGSRSIGVLCFLLLGLSVCGQHLGLIRDCVVSTAIEEVGVREETGNNDGVRVEEYIVSTGYNANSQIPWCAAFVNWTLQRCGIDVNLTYPAFSPAYFSQEKMVWSNDGRYMGCVRPGDLAGFYYPTLNRIGHVGIIVSVHEKYFVTCEGNTNGGGSRDGDGVYLKKRTKRQTRYVSNWIDEE